MLVRPRTSFSPYPFPPASSDNLLLLNIYPLSGPRSIRRALQFSLKASEVLFVEMGQLRCTDLLSLRRFGILCARSFHMRRLKPLDQILNNCSRQNKRRNDKCAPLSYMAERFPASIELPKGPFHHDDKQTEKRKTKSLCVKHYKPQPCPFDNP